MVSIQSRAMAIKISSRDVSKTMDINRLQSFKLPITASVIIPILGYLAPTSNGQNRLQRHSVRLAWLENLESLSLNPNSQISGSHQSASQTLNFLDRSALI